MIILRRGKARAILESSRNCALTAVESYNKPNNYFRSENYIVLMIIAWTKLFHAYYQATIGGKYYYKSKNGRYIIADNEKKAWDLKKCINHYNESEPNNLLNEAIIANIKFFIDIRNKIEHKYWDGSELDAMLFGERQALLLNYENLLISMFGSEYSLNCCLAFALQFSQFRSHSQNIARSRILSKDMEDIKRYIEKYRSCLSQDTFDSQEFSVKLLQVPKVSNTSRNDLAIEFVHWDSLNEEDRKNYNRLTTIIKDKIVTRNVSNMDLLRPTKVAESVSR